MRLLQLSEIQSVSGAGIIAAVCASPIAVFYGTAATVLAAAISPLVVYQTTYKEGNTIIDGISAGLSHIAIGPQIGFSIVKAAYNW